MKKVPWALIKIYNKGYWTKTMINIIVINSNKLINLRNNPILQIILLQKLQIVRNSI